MRKWFGTDGIRGVANTPPMTVETALALGRALARLGRTEMGPARVVVGRDTRESGPMLEAALVAGVAAEGGEAVRLGVLPTPGVAILTMAERAAWGVVISASHNPFADNGLKVFGPDGFKLTDAREARIEAEMHSVDPPPLGAGGAARDGAPPPSPGTVRDVPDAVGRYVEHLLEQFPPGFRLDGWKVVLDCANGAAFEAAPRAFRALRADVEILAAAPDGRNINAACGALHPNRVAGRVREVGARFGVALDGDADRAILVDETGGVADGDETMAILATRMLERGALRGDTLVTTVMSNLGLELAVRAAGGRLVRTAVGDRYVVEAMRKGGHNLGGEQSGHLIFLDRGTTGDGILAALSVAEAILAARRPLSALRGVMTRLPQTLVNVRVRERLPLGEIPGIAAAVAQVEDALGDTGRVLLRYSGTEPKARVMVEGRDQKEIERYAQAIAAAIREAIGE